MHLVLRKFHTMLESLRSYNLPDSAEERSEEIVLCHARSLLPPAAAKHLPPASLTRILYLYLCSSFFSTLGTFSSDKTCSFLTKPAQIWHFSISLREEENSPFSFFFFFLARDCPPFRTPRFEIWLYFFVWGVWIRRYIMYRPERREDT